VQLSGYKSWYIFGKFRFQSPAIMRISWFSSLLPDDGRDNTSNYATTASRPVLHNSLFTDISVLQIRVHARVVKQTTN